MFVYRVHTFWIFFAFISILAALIFGGNLLVIMHVWKANRTNEGIIRASLAVSEMLTSNVFYFFIRTIL